MSAATNTRYSLRLRPRGGGGNDDGNHGAATATSRTALVSFKFTLRCFYCV